MKKLTQRIIPLLLALVLLLSAAPAYAAGGSNSTTSAFAAGFTDVKTGSYYAGAVEWAKEAGVTAGTNAEGTTFSPAATVTRAEAVTFLWRAAGKPEPSSAVSPFSDVTDPDAYYYKAVLWAAEQGITSGVGDGRFGRDSTLAYDQILTFLCRAAGEKSADGSDWSAAAVSWAKENGLTDGLTFTAKADCPRADVVYCLWKQLAEQQTAETPAGLSDEEGAKAAIINGFLERSDQIAVSSYNIESSALMELAEEIADKDGKNPYKIATLACDQEKGQRALFLQVSYLTQGSSSAYETSEEIRQLADAVVRDVVTSGMSDYEIAKALHDWLVLNCAYDMRLYSGNMPYDSYTAYGPLQYGTSVCAGYAKAYLALLEAAGMEAEYVTGDTTRGSHAWNIVKIDGEWYHVDTTWDDPTPDKEGYVRYNYFLRSDTFMSKDHSDWTASHACTSTKYDGTTLPNTTEQAKLEEQKEEEARLEAVAADFLEFCFEAIDSLPCPTAAELQAAETLDGIDSYPTIALPSGRYSASDLDKLRGQLEAAISAKYPDYVLFSLSSSSIRLRRNDVLEEIARRYAIQKAEQERQEQEQQAKTDARVAEIEALLQEAIQNGSAAHYTFTVPEDYNFAEIKLACQKMNASDYCFGDYTSEDYQLNAQPFDKVSILNYKWQAEEELRKEQAKQEEQARLDALPAAIVEYCLAEIEKFPPIEDFQAMEFINPYTDPYPTIKLPDELYEFSVMTEALALLEEALADRYPDFAVERTWGSTIYLIRNDVLSEIERKKAEAEEAAKQEREAHVAEIEAMIQEAIRNGEEEITISADYAIEELHDAYYNMQAPDYNFDGYTSAGYQLGLLDLARGAHGVTITYLNAPAE